MGVSCGASGGGGGREFICKLSVRALEVHFLGNYENTNLVHTNLL